MVTEMDFKTVSKSKSSNSANASKAEKKKNKKSLSDAEFQPLVMKKRGVYVEKKIQPPIDAEETNDSQTIRKPPPRPRPGQKKFLASVLTILSKSTTGTQYPDVDEDNASKDRTKSKHRSRYGTGAESEFVRKSNKNKKTKFKSRILKNGILTSGKEKLVVLQSKKDIFPTSSNYSEWSRNAADGIKWSDVSYDNHQPPTTAISDVLQNNIYRGVTEGVPKLLLDKETKIGKKLRINDDPATLASENATADDKQLYNFFVDLLETTISVYNVKAEYEPSEASKTILEINESVARKLEIKNDKPTPDDVAQTAKNTRVENRGRYDSSSQENIPLRIKLSDCKPVTPVKQKVKAKSYVHPNYTRKPKQSSKVNNLENKKGIKRRNDKKTLLNILKEQLAFDAYNFEEPDSLYDALKVLARNKRRYEKSISFTKNIDRANEGFDSECMFRRRRIISLRSGKKNKTLTNYNASSPMQSTHHKQKYKIETNPKEHFPSDHSLEVYGYDYEEPNSHLEDKTRKRVLFTKPSSPSISQFNLGGYSGLLNYPPESSSSSDYSP